MAQRKRRFEEEDANQSDPDDLDYDVTNSKEYQDRADRAKKKAARRSKPRKPAKRQKRNEYGDSSDDVDDDVDDLSEEDSFEEEEENYDDEDEEPERNPKTGRAVRSAAKKPVHYEEESDDDGDASMTGSDVAPRQAPTRSSARPSLIVKLSIPSMRSQSGTNTPRAGMQRRSRRLSHDQGQPLVGLSDSGKHEVITREGTAEPESSVGAKRPVRAGKAPKKMPSAILEESQEGSQLIGQGMAAADAMNEGAGDTQKDESVDELQASDPEIVESDEDDRPIGGGRNRPRRKASTPPTSQNQASSRRNLRQRKSIDQSSDFNPDADDQDDDADMSESDGMPKPPRRSSGSTQTSRRGNRVSKKTSKKSSRSQQQPSDEEELDEQLDEDELADEAAALMRDSQYRAKSARARAGHRSTRLRARLDDPDYRTYRPELLLEMQEQEEEEERLRAAGAPSKKSRGGNGHTYRNLFQTAGPFGGFGGPAPILGGPDGQGATGGVDSDSSDDDTGIRRPQQTGGQTGMTPNSAFPKPYAAQSLNADPNQGPGGGPSGLGKIKDRKLLADADPLGVDPSVGFEQVGGLDGHINQLKEMVALPLLYPEIFQRFKVTPPRGVLFHGPPGTGKTLLARALAASVSSEGKKVTFYMRKGADALSKWVGEAERQLRLLFEEARKNQPSIIFFDEIDGLAPVRSSKQEQIHSSIVATLLALMDGMDGRGQVIVIGATNRPDSVDPALRRPGRFDREFYFPLPSVTARRAIIDIHTKGWEPPLKPEFKDQLAERTKGYGGADLRALCTEAALNAVQGTFPQIYSSSKKLIIDPSKIKVMAKDFMISVDKIVPSSERSAASGAAPLKRDIEPLLRKPLEQINELVDKAVPRKRKRTALEEAMYDDREDELGFERDVMQREFESSRVFRPRLLIKGQQGMGQQYLGSALLSKLEGLHVQNFGLSVLMSDSTRSVEAAIVQLFEEVKRHKPSVIYIPQVDAWYRTLSESAIKMFNGLLRSIPPAEPVLVIGVAEYIISEEEISLKMIRDLFGYSVKSHFNLQHPDKESREEFFNKIIAYVNKAPPDFPNPDSRKRRKLIDLPVAVEPERQTGPSKAELKAQKKRDRQTLNMLKLNIQQVMDQIKLKYKKFRTPVIEDSVISYLYDNVPLQLPEGEMTEAQKEELARRRPFVIDTDEKGVPGLREVATNRFFYNLEIVTIEKRLSNGYYKRPKDFLADIKRLAKDAKTIGDQDRILKANEILANVEVDMATLETQQPALIAECEAVYERELLREQERLQTQREAFQRGDPVPRIIPNVPPPNGSKATTETTGPVVLGEELSGRAIMPPHIPRGLEGPSPESHRWSNSNGLPQTNGSTNPSRPQEDAEMYDASQGPAKATNGQQTPATQQRSQSGLHTHVPSGSQLDQYVNSASTTSSGQKTSDRSHPQSERTNGSSGYAVPEFNTLEPTSGADQLPDTQSSQSQQHESNMPPPQRPAQIPVDALLNEPAPTQQQLATQAMPPPPTIPDAAEKYDLARLILNQDHFVKLKTELVTRSSGLSVEQLEQVQAALMETIWESKTEWNRVKVSQRILETFNEVIADIEACQKIQKASQEEDMIMPNVS